MNQKKLRNAVIEALSSDRQRLKNVARELEMVDVDFRSPDAIIQGLRRSTQGTTEELLDYLSEAEVKGVCESLNVESRGRKKYLIGELLRLSVSLADSDEQKGADEPAEKLAEALELGRRERELLQHVPADGSTIGNIRLRERLGWSEDYYRRIRDKLIAKEILSVGAGRGGSVYRKRPEGAEAAVAPAQSTDSQPRQREEALYPELIKSVEENWIQLFPGFPTPVHQWIDSSPRQGSKATGGKWTRPDISAVTLNQYHYIPGKHLDIFTFEVKPRDQLNVIGVYEALAHSRRSNFAYALYEVRPGDDPPEIENIVREATRVRVGVATFEDPSNFDTWNVRCVPQRIETEARFLNEFIEMLPDRLRNAIALAIR